MVHSGTRHNHCAAVMNRHQTHEKRIELAGRRVRQGCDLVRRQHSWHRSVFFVCRRGQGTVEPAAPPLVEDREIPFLRRAHQLCDRAQVRILGARSCDFRDNQPLSVVGRHLAQESLI